MRITFSTLLLVLLGCSPRPAVPQLTSVEPTTFDGELGAPLVLHGERLLPPVTFNFDDPKASTVGAANVSAFLTDVNGNRVELLDVIWVDATRVSARAEGPIVPGTWNVHLVEPRGTELVLADALISLDCASGECLLPDGGSPDAGTPCEELNFADLDLDGYGAGAPQMLCGPGFVPVGGDCDDRDDLTHPDAGELCNGLDDDCDGVRDLPSCADGGWAADTSILSPANDFTVASSFARGELWVAGGNRVYLRRGALGFFDLSSACPMGIDALWAEPGGEAEVSGTRVGGGVLVQQAVGTTGCFDNRDVSAPLVAIVGFPDAGGADYLGVLPTGELWRWRLGESPAVTPTNLPSTALIEDLHGVSPTQLIAVGSVMVSGGRRARAWTLGSDGGWQEEYPLGNNNGNISRLRVLGAWMLSPTDAVVVGENGAAAVRTAQGWRRHTLDTSVDLLSVRAFSTTRYYVTTEDGRVRQRAGGLWTDVFRHTPAVRLGDITGTAEDDLWAVGLDGVIVRGPH